MSKSSTISGVTGGMVSGGDGGDFSSISEAASKVTGTALSSNKVVNALKAHSQATQKAYDSGPNPHIQYPDTPTDMS